MNVQPLEVMAPWAADTVIRARLSTVGLEVWFADGVRSRLSAADLVASLGEWPTGVALDEDNQTVVLQLRDGKIPYPWDGFRYRADASYRARAHTAAREATRTVGARIRAWRKHGSWTQAELADAAGISRITLSRIEGGRHEATQSTLRAIAGALGVGVGEMMTAGPDVE